MLSCYQKAETKFPELHQEGMVYTRKALEQSSGEAMVNYKSSRLKGSVAIDGTGGLGLDTYALSRSFDWVLHIEPDAELQQIARHNHRLLGIEDTVTYVNSTLERWVETAVQRADLIYVDPSRRDESRRYFKLEDCRPDVLSLKDKLKQLASRILFKLSPMLDVDYIADHIPEASSIECCSVGGEVKEVLADISQPAATPDIQGVVLDQAGAPQHRVTRKSDPSVDRSGSTEMNYLYVPDSAVIKAGAIPSLADEYHLEIIGNPGFYLLGAFPASSFPGHRFLIEQRGTFRPKPVRKELKRTGYHRIRIRRKNFPIPPEALYSKLNVKMGDQAHLFLTRDHTGKQVYFIARNDES